MPTPERLHWICNVPIGITVSVLGIIGNILSVYIWQRVIKKNRQGNTSTGIYLITLGVCDTGLLVFFILTEGISTAEPSMKDTYSYDAFFVWFSFPMLYIFVVASIWLIVGVTINRWVLITFPTRSKDIYSRMRTYLGIAIILIFSVLINIPHWFNFTVSAAGNGTYKIEKTEYGLSQGAINYEFWCHCIVLVLVPWFTIAVLNILIIKKLRERTIKLTSIKSRTKSEKQDRHLTGMLLAITFTFLVLIAWQCVTQCFYMLEFQKDANVAVWYRVDKSFAFGKLGVVINSAVNCIFYCFFGTAFRKELRESFSSSFSRSFRSTELSGSEKPVNATLSTKSTYNGIENSGMEKETTSSTNM